VPPLEPPQSALVVDVVQAHFLERFAQQTSGFFLDIDNLLRSCELPTQLPILARQYGQLLNRCLKLWSGPSSTRGRRTNQPSIRLLLAPVCYVRVVNSFTTEQGAKLSALDATVCFGEHPELVGRRETPTLLGRNYLRRLARSGGRTGGRSCAASRR
jgi:hypothetical protein